MFDGQSQQVEGSEAEYAGKTLYERATGRFYTPDKLAADLADQMVAALGTVDANLSVCDPFCGDGQLLAAFLVRIASLPSPPRLSVALFDQEAKALSVARARVKSLAASLGLSIEVSARAGDSFAAPSLGAFDAIITNPPWELLKPDSRETAALSLEAKAAYREWLASRCTSLDTTFPEARADVSWAGWGTNLARVGWALSLRSCRPGGVVGIVLPGTLMGDQASLSMRRFAAATTHLVDLAAYPAEAKLFARVDQPVVAATFKKVPPGPTALTSIRLHDAWSRLSTTRVLEGSASANEARGYSIPVGFGAGSAELLDHFINLPTFAQMEGFAADQLWAGRELDETRIAERLVPGLEHPFIKGRMIQRFGVAEEPTCSVSSHTAARIWTTSYRRLVWRDVARASQRRRMITCIIPPGWIAGNSLHVALFRDGGETKLHALHAVMSSYVFEYLVRTRLATGHMSLGVVRRTEVPILTNELAASLASLAASADPRCIDQTKLEVAVAKAYGLRRDAFEAILKQFSKVLPQEREALLLSDLWAS